MGVAGISHITFIARGLERTAELLCVGVGAGFDNNLFELHTGTLEERLRRYLPTSGTPG